ncbi:AAA family ATPase [Prochlorothrix hollandica]|nr:AAA family ATPase [Prochlorothrix hollandica]
MNAHRLLKAAKKVCEIKTVFRFPYVHLICISSRFNEVELDDRELDFCRSIKINVAELRKILHNSLLSLRLLTADEFLEEYPNNKNRGHHWLSALIDQELKEISSTEEPSTRIKVIHFYGYKGGQARSTLLGLLSTTLAEDGWKVLVVDSDIEAPSLDIIYARTSRTLSSTLLGVIQSTSDIIPERVRTPEGSGYVDLLACRPKLAEFDIDASAFALRCALEPMIIEDAAKRIVEFAIENKYDALLIDHRSGLSPVPLPWMNTLPGPTVVCVRLDEQWRPAEHFIKSVLRTNSANPGVFVSWKPDDENLDSYRHRNNPQIDALLEILVEAISEAAEISDSFEEEAEISSVELEDHWIVWSYDSAFRQSRLPEKNQLSGLSIESLNKLRSILNVSYKITESSAENTLLLSPSGASDEGDLIQTEALRELSVHNNSISYILGRKGTGKTRLLRELSKAGVGEPLLVDSNSKDNKGLKSPSPELTRAADLYKDTPEKLWWHLLSAAIDAPETSTDELGRLFSQEMEQPTSDDPILRILEKIEGKSKRTFLIDGLETAFNAKLIFTYTEALFRFIQTVETDSRLSKYIHLKLFIRSDLVGRGFQNIEQQLHGKSLYLSWDTQKIFNFILSRISRIQWYKEQFPSLIEDIEENRADILKGSLPTEECEVLLMKAFPEKIRRNNLATKTFLKTYFADSASDRPEISTSDKLRYYPRVFDKFLQVIADPQPTDVGSFQGSQTEEGKGKISQSLIFIAHEAAAREYLSQLQSELNYLVSLSDDFSENQAKIKALLDAFEGLKTPFKLDECVSELTAKVNIDKRDIRTAIERMKNLGMFEDRPDYPGQLRVGRLFKSSLKMKYVRGKK